MDELECTDKMLMARADLESGAYSTTHAWKRRSNSLSYVELAQYIWDFYFRYSNQQTWLVVRVSEKSSEKTQSVWNLLSF